MDLDTEDSLQTLLAPLRTWASTEQSLWPEIEKGMMGSGKTPEARLKTGRLRLLRQRWALAGLAMIIFLAFNALVQMTLLKSPAGYSGVEEHSFPRIMIKYAEIRGRKARPHIYQTPTTSYILFTEAQKSGG